MIDIIEQEIIDISEEVFNILLIDRTTRQNICWATNHYKKHGFEYSPEEPITKELVTGKNFKLLKPRAARSESEKNKRTKDKAEVFTPSWICNEQNNLIDEEWFGRKNVFNISQKYSWESVKEKIEFPHKKTWKQYIDSKRLEISCGEAPYIVSRYDSVDGKEIPLSERIGLLDRKLRVVNENIDNENEWFNWARRAYESVYGYEYQGDNLLIARENLLYTFIENKIYKFGKEPDIDELKKIAKVISWNIWQMNGIDMTVPFSERPRIEQQISIFELINNEPLSDTEPIPCKIYDWRANCSMEFKSLLNGGK